MFKKKVTAPSLNEQHMLFSNTDLRHLIIPLVIEQLLGVTIGMADTMMVANVGEAAVSGISLVDSLNILLIQVFGAMAPGGAVVASQYLGRKDRPNACAAAKQLIYTTTFIALAVAAFAIIGGKTLLSFIFGSIEPEVMKNAQTYFWLSAISYPFLAIYNAGAALFRSMSNSRVSMKISMLINLINVVGNAVLIYVFHMGVAGAGIASLLSRATAAVIVMVLLGNRHNLIFIEKLFSYRFDWKMVKAILHIGVPSGRENGMFQVGKVLVSSLIARFGTVAITANAITSNLASFECIPGSAIGLAMITVIGRCVGAQDYEQARYYAKKMMKITYIAMIAVSIFIVLLCRPIATLYNPSAETLKLAVWCAIWHSINVCLTWPMSFALPNIRRDANDVKFTMTTSIVSMWTCRIAASYLLALGMGLGLKGVWIAMTLDWMVRAACFGWRFLSGKWEKKQLRS